VFEGVDPDFSSAAAKIRDEGKAVFIVAGESYGQGSSREHAALCPMFLGVKAVLAKSFERIHAANLVNFGIVPLAFADPRDYDRIEKGDELEIRDITGSLDKDILVRDKTKNINITLRASLSRRQREIVIAGGLLNYTNAKASGTGKA
jgi:aconitase (EC 4.2.1.3)